MKYQDREEDQAACLLPFPSRAPAPLDVFTIRLPRDPAQALLRFELFPAEARVPGACPTANGQLVRVTVMEPGAAAMPLRPCGDPA